MSTVQLSWYKQHTQASLANFRHHRSARILLLWAPQHLLTFNISPVQLFPFQLQIQWCQTSNLASFAVSTTAMSDSILNCDIIILRDDRLNSMLKKVLPIQIVKKLSHVSSDYLVDWIRHKTNNRTIYNSHWKPQFPIIWTSCLLYA